MVNSIGNNIVNNVYDNKSCFCLKWVKWILISVSVLISVMLLLIPLIMVFVFAMSEGFKMVLCNLINKDMIHAIFLTSMVVAIVLPINIVFGILIAWLMTRFKFYGRQLFFVLLNIPIAVSPVIVGLSYLLCYSSSSVLGAWLDIHNIQIMYTWFGIVLVTIFITYPFIANILISVMTNQGSQEDEAAVLLGASGWMMFRYVTFPNIRWALLYGIIITNSRAIGEFGAVSIVSGLIRGETYTLSLYTELLYQDYNVVGAFTAASLLALISIIMLLIKNYFKHCLKV